MIKLVPALLIFGMGATAHSVPPPVDQTGADCAAPVYASDRLVCDDEDLREMDRSIVAQSGRLTSGMLTVDNLLESSETWFRRRSRCAFEPQHRQCLLDAYRDRIAVLSAFPPAREGLLAVRCGGGLSGRRLALAQSADGVVVLSENGRILLVATKPISSAGWSPGVVYTEARKGWRFLPLGKSAIHCKR